MCINTFAQLKLMLFKGQLRMGNLSQKVFTFYHKFTISSMLKHSLDKNIFGIYTFLVSVIHITVFNFAQERKKERKKEKSLSPVQLFMTSWTVAYQAPQSMGFSRQEYWSGLPFPSPGDFPTQGSNPSLLHCAHTLYHLSYQRSQATTKLFVK